VDSVVYGCTDGSEVRQYFGTSVDTEQWAQPVTTGVHGVSSKKCRLEVVG